MRKLVYDVLTAQSVLTDIVPVPGWFEEGSVVDTPQQRPFVILKFAGTTRSVRPFGTLQVWCYDERGDYTRIDNFHRALKAFFDLAANEYQRVRSDGSIVRLALADWQGDSADLYDDVFRCNTRYGSYRIIGSGQ